MIKNEHVNTIHANEFEQWWLFTNPEIQKWILKESKLCLDELYDEPLQSLSHNRIKDKFEALTNH